MTAVSPKPKALSADVFERYQSNLPRHILGVANYLQTRMMTLLCDNYGHKQLRLSFAPYITLVGESELRVSELADILGISRQACNQAAQQVEAAGYLQRIDDPLDGRAKQLRLTKAGAKLRADGLQAISRLDETFSEIAGIANVREASKTLGKLYSALQLSQAANTTSSTPSGATSGTTTSSAASTVDARANPALAGMLPRLSDYTMVRLMELTQAKGHTGLKLSFGQVLPYIGESGGRIQEIAALHDVSKQAISAIATELQTLDYLKRETHPTDARQLVLQFSARGEALIADSVTSTEDLESEFACIVGEAALKKLKKTLNEIYLGLALDQSLQSSPVDAGNGTTDLGLLAKQLRSQLGKARCGELARLLTQPNKQPTAIG